MCRAFTFTFAVKGICEDVWQGSRKRKKMTNSTHVSKVKMTRFGYKVDLIRVSDGSL